MHALTKSSIVITFAALSLSGSAAWATGEDSFVANAKLNSLNVVPPILTSRTAELPITFVKPTPISVEAVALSQGGNPWRIRTRAPGDQSFAIRNIRLYFGQQSTNGLPIATLCDNVIGLQCPAALPDSPPGVEVTGGGAFDLSSIQFQSAQRGTAGNELIDSDGRLRNDQSGFRVIRDLIKRRLIYVVVNSPYEAEVTDGVIVGYEPPLCSFVPLFFCKGPDVTDEEGRIIEEGPIITDGELRGTLHIK